MTQAFNLSQLANNVNTSGQLNAAAGLYNQVPVANGGTGQSSFTGNAAIITNAAGTALSAVAAGASGNVLTSNGTTWVSQVASGGTPIVTIYTSPASWTKSPTLKAVKITVLSSGGGGSGAKGGVTGGGGGGGAYGFTYLQAPAIPGPQTITAGAGGAGGVAPGATNPWITSGAAGSAASFGTIITATGGGFSGPGGTVTGAAFPGGSGGGITTSPTVFGWPGFSGAGSSIPASPVGGAGGNSAQNAAWGIGGAGATLNTPGNPGLGYGSGGSGAVANPSGGALTGGNGKAGFVIVEEFY